MDSKTAALIEKFKKNQGMAQSLMQSTDGQKLIQMLTKNDGGTALSRATQNAAKGNPAELANMLSSLMKSPEGAAIMKKINETAKK